ncbi:MAG TPA: NUDIX hydrolase [Acidimicrobiales bacterium]|jgi:8-oxo-dGTP pyrophosphatase MutT (NUDIX family)
MEFEVPDTDPAATVVVVRDEPGGPEVLMLRRNSKLVFGGMWVFPGGRVDPGDADPAHPDDELAAARRAAVRESEEEAGLALQAEALVPLSHWIPPAQAPRRYATWFFLAAAPREALVTIDGGEIHEHGWLRPADALARHASGEIELAPPTWVTLWCLAGAGSTEDALAAARSTDPARFATHMTTGERGPVALWHGDAGYSDGDVSRPGARHRLSMGPGGWLYEDRL